MKNPLESVVPILYLRVQPSGGDPFSRGYGNEVALGTLQTSTSADDNGWPVRSVKTSERVSFEESPRLNTCHVALPVFLYGGEIAAAVETQQK